MMGTEFLNLWWVWMALALILVAAEIFLPGFIFLGFAAGAAIIAVLVAVTAIPLKFLFAAFAVFSLLAWITMRRLFKRKGEAPKSFERDINDN